MDVDTSHSEGEEELDHEEGTSARTYVPGISRPLQEDERLVMDKSSYRLFYELQVESPSLSFDILLDNLGSDRDVEVNGSEQSACLVAGTQACHGVNNNLVLMKLSNLRPFRLKNPNEAANGDEGDDDDSSEEDDDENLDTQPEVEAATIHHNGTVNRVRAQQYGGRYLAASWSELGKVFIWDLTRPLTAVNDSAVMSEYVRHQESPVPLFSHKCRTEGFALDWSPHTNASGHLACGNCDGRIFHFSPRPTGWTAGSVPYSGHSESVEDIQWSPTEPTVFISVSADRSIRVWDTRSQPSKGSMLTVPDAHSADINVASWNRLQPVNLVTGGDDTVLRVWDLRLINKQYGTGAKPSSIPAYTQSYEFHNKPITSVQWHPTDAGVLVATSEDDRVTIWDTTLEQADGGDNDSVDEETANLPVQLLFIHCGQTEIKEARWHPQIPGLIIVTSLDGFNVFRTCNV